MKVRSGTGEASPTELLVLPALLEGSTNAVLELGFLRAVDARTRELFARIGETLAVAVRSSENRQQARELLEETQRQGEELQSQQEELRVANEELETQATALKTTQQQLEMQQAELEQTNDDLNEQVEDPGAAESGARGPAGRDRREGSRGRAGEPVQVGLPVEHVPRAADAAQQLAHHGEAARRQRERQPLRRAGEVRRDDLRGGQRSPDVDQRHPRSVEDRGGQDGCRGGERAARAGPRDADAHVRTGREPQGAALRRDVRAGGARGDGDRRAAARAGAEEPRAELR